MVGFLAVIKRYPSAAMMQLPVAMTFWRFFLVENTTFALIQVDTTYIVVCGYVNTIYIIV